MAIILPANTLSAGGYTVDNSCRLNGGDDAYMHKTLGTPTSTKICTISFWWKQSAIFGQGDTPILSAKTDSNNRHIIYWSDDSNEGGLFKIWGKTGGSVNFTLSTTQVFRDPAAWQHHVIAIDTNQSVATNRVKWYKDGTQITSFSETTYPGEDALLEFSKASSVAYVGAYATSGGVDVFGGANYLAEFVFIDGQQLTPTSFGEYDEDSPTIWKPKDVSELTFGNNGFYLDFEDSANLGNDANGGTDLTEVNLAAADQCVDSPTNNFATLNPLHMSDPSANYFVDNGNNTVDATNNDVERQVGVTIHPQGIKGYFEFKALTDNNWRCGIQEDGVGLAKNNYTALASGQMYSLDSSGNLAYANGGSSATLTSGYISGSTATNDIIGVAFDFTGSNRNVWMHKNGTYGNNGSGVGVPATGAYPGLSVTQLALTKEFEFVFAVNTGGSSSSLGLNFGNGSFDGTAISSAGTNSSFGSFEYDVPDGFGPLCTKTLNGTYS